MKSLQLVTLNLCYFTHVWQKTINLKKSLWLNLLTPSDPRAGETTRLRLLLRYSVAHNKAEGKHWPDNSVWHSPHFLTTPEIFVRRSRPVADSTLQSKAGRCVRFLSWVFSPPLAGISSLSRRWPSTALHRPDLASPWGRARCAEREREKARVLTLCLLKRLA